MGKLFNFGKDRDLLFEQLTLLSKILFPIAIISLVFSGIGLIFWIMLMFSPLVLLSGGLIAFGFIALVFSVVCSVLLLKWISVSKPRIAQRKDVTYQVPMLILISSALSILSTLFNFSGTSALGLILNICFGYLYFMTFRAAYLLNKNKVS